MEARVPHSWEVDAWLCLPCDKAARPGVTRALVQPPAPTRDLPVKSGCESGQSVGALPAFLHLASIRESAWPTASAI
jgi:hypothetical protein